MTSSERMTCSVHHDICYGLNPIDKCCQGFSTGKLLVDSCLRELQAKPEPQILTLNLNPLSSNCLFVSSLAHDLFK